MGNDPIKYALSIGVVSLAIALVCGLYIAWINGGSRNIALGLGALAGACVILVLQIAFELKSTATSSDFAVEVVVDYGERSVHSSRAYAQSLPVAVGYRNLLTESEASKAVAAAMPPLTRNDAPRIARDLGIVSIISYLLDEQSDWQLDARSYKTSTGTTKQWMRLSTPKECSLVKVGDIREQLQAASNMFASIRLAMAGDQASLCLPPNAILHITQNTVAVRSFVGSVIITLQEPFMSMMTIDPHAVAIAKATGQPISAEVATLPDGSPRYATVEIGARATVEFAGLRAQDRDLVKYQKWTNRVAEGVKAVFAVPE